MKIVFLEDADEFFKITKGKERRRVDVKFYAVQMGDGIIYVCGKPLGVHVHEYSVCVTDD